ncbi:MAG: hypothetical protein ACREXY_06140, partial [Gammaproteobacteria bacterium]
EMANQRAKDAMVGDGDDIALMKAQNRVAALEQLLLESVDAVVSAFNEFLVNPEAIRGANE